MAGGFQLASVLIDAKGEDVSTGLIGRDQKFTGGIEAKIARSLAQRGLVLHGLQLAGFLIDAENRNRVMPAVGSVKKLPAWMHLYFRRAHPLLSFHW